MGILARFAKIMEANINDLLDRCEDSKMIDQILRDVEKDLAEVRKDTAGVLAEERGCKRILEEKEADVAEWDNCVRNAIRNGDDEAAKKLIVKKQKAQAEYEDAKKAYDVAHENSRKMQEMHDKLSDERQTLIREAESLKQKERVARTQEKVNDITSKDRSGEAMGAFGRMRSKIDRRLDEAMAMEQLVNPPKDEVDELAEKYKDGGACSVDDELAKMKEEMGLS